MLPTLQSRIQGALMGAFIGDALALGPHWYYDLEQLRQDYGEWISDYTAPRPGRYHAGLKAGDSSQAGFILELMLSSLLERGEYDESDFCQRLERDLFSRMDGSPHSGPGGYTNQSIRDGWAGWKAAIPWDQRARWADNTDAAERIIALAVRYALQPQALVRHVSSNAALLQKDASVVAMTTAYGLLLGQLVGGESLDEAISARLLQKADAGEFSFHGAALAQSSPLAGQFPSPEPLLMISTAVRLANNAQFEIQPASTIAQVYGLPCAIYNQLPAVYYLAARFQGDFESAVLHAVNGGGQNQARAILTGALCGAIGGLEALPQRLLEGLSRRAQYLSLAKAIAAQSAAGTNHSLSP